MPVGMLYLHTRSPAINHRDLKTANLLVTSQYQVKVRARGLSACPMGAGANRHEQDLEPQSYSMPWSDRAHSAGYLTGGVVQPWRPLMGHLPRYTPEGRLLGPAKWTSAGALNRLICRSPIST